jgi:FkbM family methyltransferase
MDVRSTSFEDRAVPEKFVDRLGITRLTWRADDVGGFGGESYGPVRDLYDSADSILSHCSGRGIAIQAGGNCGLYARWYSNHFDRVFTFEPTALNFLALACNSIAAPRQNIFCFNAGLGDEDGFAACHDSTDDNCGADRYTPTTNPFLESIITQEKMPSMPLMRLDDVAMNWGNVDIIHLDIEGMEEFAIRGAAKLIARDHPVVILEQPNTNVSKMMNESGYVRVDKIHSDQIFVYKG